MTHRPASHLRTLLSLVLLVLLAPGAAAHERWVRHELMRPFDRTLFESLGWTNGLTVGVLLLLSLWLPRHAKRHAHLWRSATGRYFVGRLAAWTPTLLRVSLGMTLLVFGREGVFLAPDLRAGSSVEGQLLIGTSVAAGALLVVGLHTREAALAFLLIYGWALVRCPFEPFQLQVIEPRDVAMYAEVVGMAIFLAVLGPGRLALDGWRRGRLGLAPGTRPGALAAVRVTLGGTLMLLGSMKFLVPELFMGVVQNYPEIFHLPFEQFFGTTEEEVVFGASAIEVGLGLLLVIGAYTRALAALLGTVFGMTALLFEEEVLGHVPLVAAVLLLLVEGGGALPAPAQVGEWTRALCARITRPEPAFGGTAAFRRSPFFLLGVLALGITSGATLYGLQPTLATEGPWETILDPERGSGVYRGHHGTCIVTLEVDPQSFGLGEFFTIATIVRDAESGELPADLAIEVDVSMPEHGHGMPTAPHTRRLDAGRFLTEGCKLQMFGTWLIQVRVLRDGQELDRIATTYRFQPPA